MDIESIIALVLILAFFAAYIACAAWAVGDAQKRGQTGAVVILLFWLLGPFAAFFWFLARPPETLAERPATIYDNADDTISAAIKLEMLGEWDAAIAMYENAATRWPEHRAYINECIGRIQTRQAPYATQ